ncbi:SusD/RagB family nutrient-binding outer membrane lipoprotein [Aliifodinibius sp. S!AR15-10]|uniref:SusD/RagB family nutrient-binding outer membrane lipoprotein n=1 Tax=Aliifodinibius sp. S!AR15-10 TaxID=2950437 RepID=UPI00286540E4|nr:SusD/RagB family nutrient-binding outer membrane lipoprotein [Aliifodinibius sp. S!AR15-10]MDR8389759.1 SusD/RagB family nutrient-binding outer membrane lipoprotein [Aliifodinibius sp. S!AR15-10]
MRKLILPILVLALVLVSCTDNLTDLNTDPKNPTDVPGETLFSNAQVSLGTYLTEPDVNLNTFKLMAQYWAQTTYATESRYELTTRSIPSNLWSELYRDVLKDLDKSAEIISNDESLSDAEKTNRLASIEVLKVLTYSELVNIFGDIPYSEALNPDNTQPSYEDAASIYEDLMSRLNTAISDFDASASNFREADIFYGGDVEKWQKFANSLKLRLAITLADVNNSMAQTAIEEAAPNAFESNDDNAVIPFQAFPPHANPIWEALVNSGRHDYVPSNTIIDHMNDLDDPRRPKFFTLAPDTNTYFGGTYGTTNTYSAFSHFSEDVANDDDYEVKTATLPGTILEYAEVEFILVEARERGYNVSGSAQQHYNNAIEADMKSWGVDEDDISDYLSQQSVNYQTASGTWKEKIGKQKWLSLFLQGLQGWTEWRRLDAPTLNAPPEMTLEDIPERFTYPVDEQNLNTSNYNAASEAIGGDDLQNNLFWDVN